MMTKLNDRRADLTWLIIEVRSLISLQPSVARLTKKPKDAYLCKLQGLTVKHQIKRTRRMGWPHVGAKQAVMSLKTTRRTPKM